MEFSSVIDLKNFFHSDLGQKRTRFSVKVFYVLSYSSKHPEEASTLGAFWCDDGVHFYCNAKVMGVFLGIKPNSVNTNFRLCGFVISNNSRCANVSAHYPIPDLNNWKKRSNERFKFMKNSSLKEIESIHFVEYPTQPSTKNEIVCLLPTIMHKLVSHEDRKSVV